ncbi:MAG: cyclic-di-AMP receptor [Firmicutes bacterium]|nr:cyclic-di-AMP receptor [Bacillota bacterium]
MKLVIAVVRDECAAGVQENLTRAGFGVTKLASTGGFLKAGNSTLLVGVEAEKVDQVLEIIRRSCPPPERVQRDLPAGEPTPGRRRAEVVVGGATVFVLGVDQWLKV